MNARYPATRLRRTRMAPWSRELHREHRLHPADLIWPLFVCEGEGREEPIAAMPGVVRRSVDWLVPAVREAAELGIPAVALFPYTPPDRRDPDGEEALNPDNLVCRATRALKDSGVPVGVMTDVALDPYTDHGHDGVLDARGLVANDASVERLVEQALNQSRAGADIVAPSDMMDGRVAAIRAALEADGFHDVQIMSYAAKYASAFYGPFRAAVGSGARLTGDKRHYQMDPGNAAEALAEVALDVDEGADSVMVKPGLPYLDIVRAVAERVAVPVFAYQVSGEYAMIEAAANAGVADRRALALETLLAFRRAGARGVLTYYALDAARWLAEG